ncbi:MAG: hypothetical protein ACRDID_22420, partial [Ktedonobacterales bacterium]
MDDERMGSGEREPLWPADSEPGRHAPDDEPTDRIPTPPSSAPEPSISDAPTARIPTYPPLSYVPPGASGASEPPQPLTPYAPE